jgi:glutamyl-tRNA reductase
MTLLALGINHKTASLSVREKLALAPSAVPEQLRQLTQVCKNAGAMILSTCNRTEFYCHAAKLDTVKAWLLDHYTLARQMIEPCLYSHDQGGAVRHILRVANGLDSMIVGEPQILGQMKEAYGIAREAGTLNSTLEHLFQYVFASSKEIRTRTQIGAHPVSAAYISVRLAKRIFSNLKQAKVLLIGAGETIELTAKHLQEEGVETFYLANRSQERGQALAARINAKAIALSAIPLYLKEADIVITATQSTLPILGKGMIEQVLKGRKHRPLFMVDLAVPRDIEPEIASLADVYLYNIDDLQALAQEGQGHRLAAAQAAEQMIELQVEHYFQRLRSLEAVDLIRVYRDNIEQLRDAELAKALVKLDQGAAPALLLQTLAHNLSNKFMHAPTTQLRKASREGDVAALEQAAVLLGLKEGKS